MVWSIAALVTLAAVLGLTGCPSPSGNGEEDFYTVTFNSAEGTPAPAAQSVASGGKAVAPSPVPLREGYVLEGWYTEAAGTNPWDFAAGTVTANITLYAKWLPVEPGSWAVGFDVQGGSPAPAAQIVADRGKAATPSPVPAKEGHLLEGWYKDAEYTSRWNFASSTVTANITLYAKWSPVEPGKVVVSFDAQGGSPVPAARSVDSGSKLSRPANPVKANYDFAGWYKEAAGTSPWDFAADTVTEDCTLYAQWTLKKYAVTFDSRGGGAVAAQTVEHGGKAAEPETPVNGALILEGWYKESSFATRWDFALDTVVANTTLYARWVDVPPGYYLVSFNSRGGAAVAAQTVAENGKAAEPEPPLRENYVFDAWHKEAAGGNVWDFAVDTVTANTTLYAQWTPVYTVSFDSRGGSSVESIENVLSGAVIAKPAADPVRADFSFAGWHKEAAGTNPWNFASDTVTANLTLYAKWIPLYVVAFDSRGGSSVAGIEDVLSGAVITKPADPVLGGCSFAGWFKEALGTNPWDFAADPVTADTTLYAKWTVTASFDTQGGSAAPAPQILTRGGLAARPETDPVLAGKNFAGWYKEPARTTEWNFATDTLAASAAIYAKWIFVPVSGIRNVPENGLVSELLDLSGAVADPPDASLRTIVWSVKTPGAGLGLNAAPPFGPTELGTLVLTATVVNGGESGNYTEDFSIVITKSREVAGIDGIGEAVQTGLSAGYVVDLGKASVRPSNASYKDIVWTVKTAGAGAGSAIPADKKITLTQTGTLELTATIALGSEDDQGNLSNYVREFSFTVDRVSAPGGVGFDGETVIELYANDGAEPLGADQVIVVPRDTEYFLTLDSSYSNIVWRFDGNLSTVSGGKIYLDTTRVGPVEVTVEAELGGVRDDSVYTFVIE
jgi:uncharacterized repeat protein (TIGR02543 family)